MKTKVLYYVISITGLVLIPLFFLTSAIDPFFQARTIILNVLIFTLSIIHLTGKDKITVYKSSLPLIAWAGYCFFLILSVFTAINKSEYLITTMNAVGYGMLLYLVIISIESVLDFALILSRVCCAVVLLLSVVGIMQFYNLGFTWIPGNLQPYGTMGHKNLFSTWLLMAFLLIIYSLLTDNIKWKIISVVDVTLGVFCIVATQTRATWAGGGAALVGVIVLYFIVWFKSRKTQLKLSKYIPLLTITISIIVLIGAYALSSGLNQNMISGESGKIDVATRAASVFSPDKDVSSQQRLRAWKNSMTMVADYPFFGVGAGNWKFVLPKYSLKDYFDNVQSGFSVYLQPHNDFISVLCETGIFGLLCYLAIFVSALIYTIKAVFKSTDEKSALLGIMLFGGILGYCVNAFFNFPKDRVEHSVLLIFILALVVALYSKKKDVIKTNSFVLIFGIIISIFSIYISTTKLFSEVHEKEAIIHRANQDWDNVIKDIDNAYNPPFSITDPVGTPYLYYKAEAYYMKKEYPKALDLYFAALKSNPYHLHIINDIGTTYAVSGDLTNAIKYYLQALEISPRFEFTPLNLSAVYFNSGNPQKAWETIQKCNLENPSSQVRLYYETIRAQIYGEKK